MTTFGSHPPRPSRRIAPFALHTAARGACAAAVLAVLAISGCASAPLPASVPVPPAPVPIAAPAPAPVPAAVPIATAVDTQAETARINTVLDGWHRAAAAADEEAYFGHMSDGAIFLGTDATERWDKPAFRKFAHPHFARGKAWNFTPTRRAVSLSQDGTIAWFDEDLATPNLGPSRGSGVLLKQEGSWRIAHYNLTLTIPNDSLDAVKKALKEKPLVVPSEE